MRKLKYLYYFPVYISSEMFLMTVELMFLYPINIFSSFMKLWQYYSWKINLFSFPLLVGSGNKCLHKIKLRNFDNNRKFILAFVPQLMCWPLLSPLLFILSLHVKKKRSPFLTLHPISLGYWIWYSLDWMLQHLSLCHTMLRSPIKANDPFKKISLFYTENQISIINKNGKPYHWDRSVYTFFVFSSFWKIFLSVYFMDYEMLWKFECNMFLLLNPDSLAF